MQTPYINLSTAIANGAAVGIVIAFLNALALPDVYTQYWLTDGLIAYGTIAAGMAVFGLVALAANHLSLSPAARDQGASFSRPPI